MKRSRFLPTPRVGICAFVLAQCISACSLYAQYWGSDQVASTTSDWNSGWGSGWDSSRWCGTNSGAQWTLGVNGTNTQTGVFVNQVSPNTAAARAGINPRDNVLCVAGKQVGQVGGKIFDLAEELNRNADSSGRVPMLVQDSRTLQLRPLVVQLDSQQGGLSGTLAVRSGQLPPDALITVQLENISRPHYEVRNGTTSFRAPSYSTAEIPFSLNFDPNYIFPSDTYRIRALATSGGRTILDTAQTQYVLTQGNPNTVRLTLTPVSYSPAGDLVGSGSGSVVTASYANYDAIGYRVTKAYQQYLGRLPSAIELAAWHQLPDIEYRLGRLPLELMGCQEYYDMVGNNNVVWLSKVFTEVIGRAPSAAEQDQWMRRFAELGYSRTELLNQLKSVAGR
jgi:uncharacterized lipoprotein YbaY